MRIQSALVILLLTSTVTAAEPPKKKPWEWTTEERIAARVDPAAIARRVAAAKGKSQAVDSIQGHDHPELFLPGEIMDTFVRMTYGFGDDETSRHMREVSAKGAASIGLPADFMKVFERETAESARIAQQEVILAERHATEGRRLTATWDQMQRYREQQCALHAAAIERLRAMYGVTFDRFLYEVAAPPMFRFYISEAASADKLRRIAEGCR